MFQRCEHAKFDALQQERLNLLCEKTATIKSHQFRRKRLCDPPKPFAQQRHSALTRQVPANIAACLCRLPSVESFLALYPACPPCRWVFPSQE